jgi:hypothetical protein
MSIGNTFNKTSLDIAEAQYKTRLHSPSLIQKDKWHKEFLESGAQYRISFAAFLKEKTKHWHRQKNWKLDPKVYFRTGKYKSKKIKDIVNNDLGWIEFILKKNPKGLVAKQIVDFFNNPDII